MTSNPTKQLRGFDGEPLHTSLFTQMWRVYDTSGKVVGWIGQRSNGSGFEAQPLDKHRQDKTFETRNKAEAYILGVGREHTGKNPAKVKSEKIPADLDQGARGLYQAGSGLMTRAKLAAALALARQSAKEHSRTVLNAFDMAAGFHDIGSKNPSQGNGKMKTNPGTWIVQSVDGKPFGANFTFTEHEIDNLERNSPAGQKIVVVNLVTRRKRTLRGKGMAKLPLGNPRQKRTVSGNSAPVEIPAIITHKNMDPLLDAISADPYFQPGPQTAPRPKWVDQEVVLEMPTGEIAKDGLTTLALVGRRKPEVADLSGKEGFNAQGLEGKVRIKKDLFIALMNLRDIIPPFRGRILTREQKSNPRHRNPSSLICPSCGGRFPDGTTGTGNCEGCGALVRIG